MDYLAPTLYFLDLLLLVSLLLTPLRALPLSSLSPLVLILLANLLFSHNPLATLSWSLHFLLYFSFCFSLPPRALSLAPPLLVLSGLFQVLLGALQVMRDHSLGGPLYYLGERLVSVGQPGVAQSTILDHVVLRAYGTFGHPNVLAGWLLLVLLIVLLSRRRLTSRLVLFQTLLTTLGIILTHSRSAALTLFGLIFPFSYFRSLRARLLYLAVLGIIVLSFWSFVLPPRSELSVSERVSLQRLSVSSILHFPLFGTGAQAALTLYPTLAPSYRLLQPDHNSLTLLLSWFGFVGLLALVQLLPQPNSNSRSPRKLTPQLLRRLGVLLPLLLLDHYLLTSPQGLFLLIFYLRLVSSSTIFHSNST